MTKDQEIEMLKEKLALVEAERDAARCVVADLLLDKGDTQPAAAHGDEYEIWSAAQLSPGEGIEDGAERIRALIGKPTDHVDEES